MKIFAETLHLNTVKIRYFARLIGLIVSTFPVFSHRRMYYRELEHAKLTALKIRKFKWNKTMHITESHKILFRWWLNTYTQNVPHFYGMKPIQMTLEVDASLRGWGCHLVSVGNVGAQFSLEEAHHSINTKELLAVKYALQTYKHQLYDVHFVLKSDSTTCLHDLRVLGSMKNRFRNELVKEIWTLLTDIKAQVTLSYINTRINKVTDENSRFFSNPLTEWEIQFLHKRYPQMNFDLFSSLLNQKMDHFLSRYPSPGCEIVDCFSFDWNTVVGYAFPPPILLLKSLVYVKTSKVSSVFFLIPVFERSVWYPLLQEMLVEPLLFLPRSTAKKLTLPFETNIKQHPLVNTMGMAFAHLLGNC